MKDEKTWDWQTPEKQIPVKEWESEFNWVQAPCVSPDGEKIAAIVNTDDMEFNICTNGETWPEPGEKAWSLKFVPDGRLVALISNDEEWAVGVDGSFWETRFDYIWDLKFTPNGSHIGAAIQKDGEYGMVANDVMWENLYQSISGIRLSPQGNTAAVVQVDPMGQADIATYDAGIFSAAMNGDVPSEKYMNIKDICFDIQGKKIGYVIRKDRLNYSISDNHQPWNSNFQYAWAPHYLNNGGSLIAPVRSGGKWFMFKDDADLWQRSFEQIWHVTTHDATGKIAAVVAEDFGKWKICENNNILNFQCDTMISELFYSDDGAKLIALCKNQDTWDIVVNGTAWELKADKLWSPVISSDNSVMATRMEKNGRWYLVVNGKTYPEDFDMVFEPGISPDNSKILLKSIKNGIYSRRILSLDSIL